MTWRNEQPRESPPHKPAGSKVVAVLRALTFIFLFIAAAAAALSVSSVYSLNDLHNCTAGQLLHMAWLEFRYFVVWPLIPAAVAFVAWRVSERHSGGVT